MIVQRLFSRKFNKESEPSSSSKAKKDAIKLVSGITSGTILGGSLGKYVDTIYKSSDIDADLVLHPEKQVRLRELTGGNKKLMRAALDEVASSITPETIKKVKRGAKYGALVGGAVSGANIIRKRAQKDYSESLPDDWNEKDDKYINLVEKAKKRNKLLFDNLNTTRNIAYASIGAASGLVPGYKSGRLYKGLTKGKKLLGKSSFIESHPELVRSAGEAIKRGAIGLSISELGSDATEIATGGKLTSNKLKEQAQKERDGADKILKKYKRMKTSEERDEFRKKIGVKF